MKLGVLKPGVPPKMIDVLEYQGFIHKFSRGDADLFQVGMEALLLAAKDFDPTRGVKFTSYAHARVQRHIQKYKLRYTYAVNQSLHPSLHRSRSPVRAVSLSDVRGGQDAFLTWEDVTAGVLLPEFAAGVVAEDSEPTKRKPKEPKPLEPLKRKSGIRGIWWHGPHGRWYAMVKINGVRKYVGSSKSLEEATEIQLAQMKKLGLA